MDLKIDDLLEKVCSAVDSLLLRSYHIPPKAKRQQASVGPRIRSAQRTQGPRPLEKGLREAMIDFHPSCLPPCLRPSLHCGAIPRSPALALCHVRDFCLSTAPSATKPDVPSGFWYIYPLSATSTPHPVQPVTIHRTSMMSLRHPHT